MAVCMNWVLAPYSCTAPVNMARIANRIYGLWFIEPNKQMHGNASSSQVNKLYILNCIYYCQYHRLMIIATSIYQFHNVL